MADALTTHARLSRQPVEDEHSAEAQAASHERFIDLH
jgi:hypothetical protein